MENVRILEYLSKTKEWFLCNEDYYKFLLRKNEQNTVIFRLIILLANSVVQKLSNRSSAPEVVIGTNLW